MCLLICAWTNDGSLVVAANRDERYARPTREPFVWPAAPGEPKLLAGRDEQSGGTWLAVNEHDVLAAVTNRASEGGDKPSRPSRGQLPLLACRHRSAGQARQTLQDHLSRTRYNGFNLFIADLAEAYIIQAPGGPGRVDPVNPGLHLLGNGAWDDLSDPRLARAAGHLAPLPADPDALVARLRQVCRDHQGADQCRALCHHGSQGGTVSSTILVISPPGRLTRYLYAPGPPCRASYQEVAVNFQPGVSP